jgi:hypothetical protein
VRSLGVRGFYMSKRAIKSLAYARGLTGFLPFDAFLLVWHDSFGLRS